MNAPQVFGTEKLSKEFVEDLKVLLKYDPEECSRIALQYVTDRSFDKDDLLSAVAELHPKPGDGESLARLILYYAKRLLGDRLPEAADEDIRENLSSLSILPEEQDNFLKFVGALSRRREKAAFEGARHHCLSVGPPKIRTAVTTCDLRCIYEPRTAGDDEEGEEPEPGSLLGVEPVVLLELLTTLNDVRENHVFQLTERNLRQIIRVLRRAERRCKQARAAFMDKSIITLLAQEEEE